MNNLYLNKKINSFKAMGFVNFSSNIFDNKDSDYLKKMSQNIYNNLKSNHVDFINDDGAPGVLNLPFHNKEYLEIINKAVCNSALIKFLHEIIGNDFKIWDISYRISMPGDKGLYLHQDGPGQLNMAILLNDSFSKKGNTAFLSSSHLLFKSLKSIKLEIPPFLLNALSFMFSPMTGKKGTIYFFSNKTWHGRFSNKSKDNNEILFLGFFPKGYRYGKPWNNKVLRASKGLFISNLLATQKDFIKSLPSGCELRENGEIFKDAAHGFTINIEDKEYLAKNSRISLFLITKIFLINFLMRSIMFLRKVFR